MEISHVSLLGSPFISTHVRRREGYRLRQEKMGYGTVITRPQLHSSGSSEVVLTLQSYPIGDQGLCLYTLLPPVIGCRLPWEGHITLNQASVFHQQLFQQLKEQVLWCWRRMCVYSPASTTLPFTKSSPITSAVELNWL
jgi:hypothetical protein